MAEYATMAATTGLSMVQQRQQQKAQARAYQRQAADQAAQLRRKQDIENRNRRDQAKRALATQRARFGAAGLGGRGGSADAVLQGFRNRTEQAIADQEEFLGYQLNDIGAAADRVRRQNLLERRNFIRQNAFDMAFKGLDKLSLLDQ